MRTIKFRGKSIDNEEWVYGDLIHKAFTVKGIIVDVGIAVERCYPIEVDPKTVGQFTGILDRNGKEIYEHDLLHRHLGVYWQVVFKYDRWVALPRTECGLSLDASQFKEAEIIGNIHDNPELLK